MAKSILNTRLSRMAGANFTRRGFLAALGLATVGTFARRASGIGNSSQVDIVQIVYPGGNWQPRPTALRRLAFELQKRTAANMVLEPTSTRPLLPRLTQKPLAYLSGDRAFTRFEDSWITNLQRYLNNGGTLIIDPAYTMDGDASGFMTSVDELMASLLPETEPSPLMPEHVIFRTFYELSGAAGRVKGSTGLTGYKIGERVAVILGDHDMGGAWARDNLGNWEYEVEPGGARQRENAFRLGINIVMYALCGDYKNEAPHKRFGADNVSGSGD